MNGLVGFAFISQEYYLMVMVRIFACSAYDSHAECISNAVGISCV